MSSKLPEITPEIFHRYREAADKLVFTIQHAVEEAAAEIITEDKVGSPYHVQLTTLLARVTDLPGSRGQAGLKEPCLTPSQVTLLNMRELWRVYLSARAEKLIRPGMIDRTQAFVDIHNTIVRHPFFVKEPKREPV